MKRRSALITIAGVVLSGCSEAPKPEAKKPKEPEKPPEPVTGRYAFYQMYTTARAWAPDCQPLRLVSITLPDVKNQPGKTGAWRAIFVSPSRGRARPYTYSVIDAGGNLHKGVFNGPEENYAGPTRQAKPFLVAALRTDSDEALQTALKKSAEYVKKNPDKPISFQIELTDRFPNPAWRVIWGESVSLSNYSIFVDASTGDYLQTMH